MLGAIGKGAAFAYLNTLPARYSQGRGRYVPQYSFGEWPMPRKKSTTSRTTSRTTGNKRVSKQPKAERPETDQVAAISAEEAPDKDAAAEIGVSKTDTSKASADGTEKSTQPEVPSQPVANQEHMDDAEIEASRAVDVVVDRRSPEPDNPQPIHPMTAMTAQLSEPIKGAIDETVGSSDGETITVEAINTTAEAVPDGNDDTEHQLQQQLVDAENEAKRLAQALADATLNERALKQEIAHLKAEVSQANTQMMQVQSQLNDQDKNQREIDKLKGAVTTVKAELDEAKHYILHLTEQLTTAQASAPPSPSSHSPSHDRLQDRSQLQSSTTFPPPLVRRAPHTRVVTSPRTQPRRPAPRPIAPMVSESPSSTPSSGLPPMSTERFGNPTPISPQRSSNPLRPAYTRPGFSSPPSTQTSSSQTSSTQAQFRPGLTSGAAQPQPMPPLESITRDGNVSDSNPSPSTTASSPSAAIVPKSSSLSARRRSRYDQLKPELQSSDIPQPKVSDAEIGWFD